MDASELSERVKKLAEAGNWLSVQAAVNAAWHEQENDFGLMRCSYSGYESLWVRFRTHGYPFSLRRRWEEADDRATLEIVLEYVTEWNLPDVSGAPALLPDGLRSAALLDEVEDSLVIWLVRAFRQFWRVELTQPRKNSSPPLPRLSTVTAAGPTKL